MAWKKIVVSGSTAQLSTLNVDSTVVADQLSGSFSGSFAGNGSNLTNINVGQLATISSTFSNQTSISVQHNFNSEDIHVSIYGASNEYIIPATVVIDDGDNVTITFGTSTSGRAVVSRGGHLVSGSVPFSNIIAVPTLVSASAEGSAQGTIALNGVDVNINGLQTDDNPQFATLEVGNASDTTITRAAAGQVAVEGNNLLRANVDNVVSASAQLATDISGSFVSASNALGVRIDSISTDFDDITNKPTLVSSSVEGDAQGQLKINGVNVDVNALGSGDSPTFASVTTTGNVTIAGDLNVTGDTIQAQVTNLNVEDKFILLNSGSTTGDAGIVFGGAGGVTANTGDGIFYDDSDSVFAFAENIASNATTATNASKIGNIEVASSNPSSAPTFQGIGSIHVNDSDEGIWIYS